MKIRMKSGVLAGLLVAGMVGVARGDGEKLPFTVSKETTGIVSPLREDGAVDYVGAMNERYGKGVKAEENVVVGWLKAAGTDVRIVPREVSETFYEMCGGKPEPGWKWTNFWEYLQDHGGGSTGDLIRAPGRLWSENDFPGLAGYLTSQKEYLDLATEAFARNKYWVPIVPWDGKTSNGECFFLSRKIRDSLLLVGGRATLRMKEGDFEAFLADSRVIVHAGKLMQAAGSVDERLQGTASVGMVSRMIGAAAGSGTLSQRQCLQLWKLIDEMEQAAPIAEAMDVGERWLALERAELVATGKVDELRQNPNRFGWVGRDNTWSHIEVEQVDWDGAMKAIHKLVDERIATVKKSTVKELLELEKTWDGERMAFLRNGEGGKKAVETGEDYTKRVAGMMVQIVTVNWARAELTVRETEMQRKMARVVVGLAAFHVEKKKWPEKLSELVPDFVKEIPKDIYSEGEKAEILMAAAESGVRVYSVGTNGKDDGGVKDDPDAGTLEHDDILIGAGVDPK